MLKDFVDMFKIPQLQKKVFFTLLVIVAYRIGTVIPIPGINIEAVKSMFAAQKNGFLDFLNMFSGGALSRMSIFSLGIMPYINASIIMSLIQGVHVIPYLDKLAKEGEHGRKKLSKITKLMTLVIGTIHSFGLTMALTKMSAPARMCLVIDPSSSWFILTITTLVTGTILILWLGEQITERGIGNGVSIIIFVGIVERLPHAVISIVKLVNMEELSILFVLILAFIVIGVLILVVWVETAQRRIPIHYAKKVVGRKMYYGGQVSFLPIKVDQSGVIAVIFSMSILSVPLVLAQFTPNWTIWNFPLTKKIEQWFTNGSAIHSLIYVSFIIFFCYFYNSISFNPKELAENMKKSAAFIPGIRPGEPTSIYIQKVLERITLSGALFIASLAVLPDYLRAAKVPFFFGGTSLLIVIGVSLDTIGQIESHLIMRHYEGFVNKDGSRIKGRWFNVK